MGRIQEARLAAELLQVGRRHHFECSAGRVGQLFQQVRFTVNGDDVNFLPAVYGWTNSSDEIGGHNDFLRRKDILLCTQFESTNHHFGDGCTSVRRIIQKRVKSPRLVAGRQITFGGIKLQTGRCPDRNPDVRRGRELVYGRA